MYVATQSPHFVLVDTQSEMNVDRDVVPAAIEFVLRHIVSRQMKGELPPELCLLSIDRPVRHFESVSKRGTIPPANVVDCYKNWHREWIPPNTADRENRLGTTWHIANTLSPEDSSKAFLQTIRNVFSTHHHTQFHGRIVVIDSLTSILSLSRSLSTLIHLLDSLSIYNCQNGSSNLPITLVSTIQSSQLESSLSEGLRKLAGTYVAVHQMSLKRNARSPSDMGRDRDLVQINVAKRKLSGRMHFEEHIAKMDWNHTQLHKLEKGFDGVDSRLGESREGEKEDDPSLELAQHELSFRVTLSSKEREVRAAVGLPYIHKDEALADSALVIHPENLRLRKGAADEIEGDSSDSSASESDEEDLFSEDV